VSELCACEHQFDGVAFGDAIYGPSLAEHHRALPVEEDAILGEESHGSGEYEAFDDSGESGHGVHDECVSVADPTVG
jgi:hypothetical protein